MSQALAGGDTERFGAALAGFDSVRHSDVTIRVRLVASGLQSALERFRMDSRLIDLAQRQVPDARHRLAHVLRLTDDAAHRTMDLIEQCCPLVDQIAQQAERLQVATATTAAPAATAAPEALQQQFATFLTQVGTSMAAVRSNLSAVLLAQGYQDLSGQIIRGVMVLVDELEQALADLLCIAGADSHRDDASVGGISGISGSRVASSGSAAQGYGPPVPGIDHGPAVCGQDDIDALLSDLGM